MSELQTRITAIDIVLAVFALEALALIGYYALTKRGISPTALLPNLISGGMIVIALRLWLSAAPDAAIGFCLLASFAAHLADLRQRWQTKPKGADVTS